MELSLTIPRDDFDIDSLSAAADRFMELVPDHEHVRINVTTNFVEAVRAAVDDPEYAAAYEQDREFGFAAAKTITQSDGSIDLIVEAGLFSHDANPDDALQAFEHEAMHIVMRDRDESLSDLRLRRGEGLDTAAGTWSGICGVACEEYRVERAIWSIHPEARDDSHRGGFERLLCRFDDAVRAASIQYQRDLDVSAISKTVTEAFHALCTSTAYVAAELDADPSRDVDVDRDLDERLLGEPWRAVVTALQQLPPADTPASREELERVAEGVKTVLAEWFRHIGFALTDEPDGGLHFAVLNPEQWVSWSDLL
ncbi:MAG TPA: hypothetical protein VF712_18650 [Thermoleophilaceae bacterium]